MHRLFLGEDYKNIRQIIGMVTGFSRSPHNPEFIDQVTVRTPEGTQDISATLVIVAISLTMHTKRPCIPSDCTVLGLQAVIRRANVRHFEDIRKEENGKC
ncbi:uncharacterized protein BT62DRAFT_310775 [Guyanagaster necrorhizus]|uniref:Uncharacterized protein n=1 Tax=Guyanagaster necrorhizus TaxID=856835 RepID=A0A9P8AQN3_9AGAR|nr:uncharacterized protein BT62DRAFT_310775 [Guyanagaster necrorhizus MCA 3950]KAG7444036.1 hypothetical protein BT62DRAFT_310775 [Guyanagaster necrorhizus MCA 3950]